MKVSIITPSLNCRRYLPLTLASILSQRGDFDLQCIIIDGNSCDGTVDFLKGIRDPRVQWISQNDGGQSAAINRGLSMADGDIVAWLNSDDLYAPDALNHVVWTFQNRPQAQWLIGRCSIINEQGREIRKGLTAYKNRHMRYYSYTALLRENMICQPAVFWRRDFGQSIGDLDESLEYTMDYDLWLRMGRRLPPLFVDRLLAHFRLYPQSKSGRVAREQFDEQYRVACRHLNGNNLGRMAHRFNVEKIVWAYRLMRVIGY